MNMFLNNVLLIKYTFYLILFKQKYIFKKTIDDDSENFYIIIKGQVAVQLHLAED